jgi:ribosome-associated protein
MSIWNSVKDIDFTKELDLSASRSSGPGGQNVNKVSTKMTLRFDVMKSELLPEEAREILIQKWTNKLTTDGVLILQSQVKRTQLQNKELVIDKFYALLEKAFQEKKPRKATRPSKAAVEKRLNEKKRTGEKKKWRSQI